MNRSIILLLFITVGVAACKTTKPVTTPRADAEDLRARELLDSTLTNELQYQTISGKLKLDYTNDGKNTSVKADIRMQKDSVIWLSITPGFVSLEVARVLIDKDSIHIMDRVNKKYIVKPISYIQDMAKAPVDFKMLQSLLSGGIIYFEGSPIKSDISGRNNLLISANERLQNTIYIIPQLYKVEHMEMVDLEEERKMTIRYQQMEMVEGQRFPMKRTITAQADDKVEVAIEYTKIKINEPLQFPFSVSDTYEVVR